MDLLRQHASPMSVAAALSVVFLLAVIVMKTTSIGRSDARAAVAPDATPQTEVAVDQGLDWQQEMLLLGLATDVNPAATSSTDTLGMIGPVVMAQLLGGYSALVDSGIYNAVTAQETAAQIAAHMRAAVPYTTYSYADIKTDPDTSYERMMQYREDLQEAFLPLMENEAYELDLLAQYAGTGDETYLERMRAAAANYREAAARTADVVVPADAVEMHRAMLNAMEYFAAVLDALATHADDPFASAALIRSYNDAELAMLTSFDELGPYYRSKQP